MEIRSSNTKASMTMDRILTGKNNARNTDSRIQEDIEAYGQQNETVASAMGSMASVKSEARAVKSGNGEKKVSQFNNIAILHKKTLRQLRETRRNTNNYSSCNNLFKTTSPQFEAQERLDYTQIMKQKKVKKSFSKKVDLSNSKAPSSQGMMADVNMSMNGMGVYMNVIRESQDVIAKKEQLQKQRRLIMGLSFENFKSRDLKQLNNFI